MQDWDAATNMTKGMAAAPAGVVDNRAKFMLEQMGK